MKINKLSRFAMGLGILALYFNFLAIFGIGLIINDLSGAFITMSISQFIYLVLIIISIACSGYNMYHNSKQINYIALVSLIISLLIGYKYFWNDLILIIEIILISIQILISKNKENSVEIEETFENIFLSK